jgi:hypothetical protein
LSCRDALVDDLSPLKGMPLRTLLLDGTKISELSPLQGMKLFRAYPITEQTVTGTPDAI